MTAPAGLAGLRHLALRVRDLDACRHFYQDLLGMQPEWQPDADNLYLSSGCDNLALHVVPKEALNAHGGTLDHFGFILRDVTAVEQWYIYLKSQGVPIVQAPKHHRDGAASFYCRDPEGNQVQFIYHPPIACWPPQADV